jgi:hypothetical protein
VGIGAAIQRSEHAGKLEPILLESCWSVQCRNTRPSTKEGISARTLPRKYSWFSELLLDSLRAEEGKAALIARCEKLGHNVAVQLQAGQRAPETVSE